MKQLLPLIVLSVLAGSGCGNPEEEEHIWKDQVDLIDKAGEVEETLLDASRQQRRQIDEMAQ